jgi:dTDP-4-dehydrorhamnose 3,5-epimerase
VKFHPTPLHGAYTIELEKRGDDRGFFARFFCQKEFEAAGVPMPIVQINNSLSAKAGTLRGMHYQLAPAAEIKVVRCIRGARSCSCGKSSTGSAMRTRKVSSIATSSPTTSC